jgi:hypothetical protein
LSDQTKPIQVTIKASDRSDAPWLNIVAEDPQVLFGYLNGLKNGSLELIAEFAGTFQDFWATQVAARNVAQGGLTAPQTNAAPVRGPEPWDTPPSAPVAHTAPPVQHGTGGAAPQVKVCPHGQRTRRTGTNARGPWVAHFCPLQKGDPSQCEPVWGD